MQDFSIISWIIVLGMFALVGIPIARILRRAGFSQWWVILSFVPVGNLIGLWLLAFSPWKSDAAASANN